MSYLNYEREPEMNEQPMTPGRLLNWVIVVTVCLVVLIALIWGGFALGKKYSIWAKEQDGRAKLAEAQFSKQVKTEEAKANLESEKLNALSEIERAKGAAESIKIEGGQLTDNYIKYLWVRNMQSEGKQIIYVPTEAGLPLLEAGKR